MDWPRWTLAAFVAATGALCLVLPWHEMRITNDGNGSGDVESAGATVWGQGELEFGPDGIWYASDYDGKPGAVDLRVGLPVFVLGVLASVAATVAHAAGRLARAPALVVLGIALLLGGAGAVFLVPGLDLLTVATRQNYGAFLGVTVEGSRKSGGLVAIAWGALTALTLAREAWVGYQAGRRAAKA